ncbi:MAG: hypothetical protein DRP85_01830 [Candidatus Makaraimicrobium thalassicum]|nr:MAG: hypothetical protein DRP85_01830 [Candidatus Omnitrophota bacterium]
MRLYGKNPVLERIRTDPRSVRSLYLQKRTDLSGVAREAGKAGITFESVDRAWFRRKCGDAHAQGVMAEVDEFKYASFSAVLAACIDNVSIPVFLDRVTDPQNLGAIIRVLACLGGFSLVLPEYESAHVNETVLRVANGGENYIKIARVPNIAPAVRKAKKNGVWIAGALVSGSNNLVGSDLMFPLALIIGSEGKGIRPGLQKHLDTGLSLPMRGAPLSYNVAVATSIFCYEINRRRWTEKPRAASHKSRRAYERQERA